jgi:hypothetical protein
LGQMMVMVIVPYKPGLLHVPVRHLIGQ